MVLDFIVITGPTATGKSDVAIKVALQKNGVIINCDSRQVYKEMPIITAQPPMEDMEVCEHRLYGYISIIDQFRIVDWLSDVKIIVKECMDSGKLPIFTGGSGLNIKALIDDMVLDIMIPEEIKELVSQELERAGLEEMYKRLLHIDPGSAAKIHPKDQRRVLRAIEVFESTGYAPSILHKEKSNSVWGDSSPSYKIFVVDKNRQEVYNKINSRFVKMIDLGMIDEVKRIKDIITKDMNAYMSHGVPEIIDYLDNKISLECAIEIAQRNTRHYAKRQWTWCRNQYHNAIWVGNYNELLDNI